MLSGPQRPCNLCVTGSSLTTISGVYCVTTTRSRRNVVTANTAMIFVCVQNQPRKCDLNNGFNWNCGCCHSAVSSGVAFGSRKTISNSAFVNDVLQLACRDVVHLLVNWAVFILPECSVCVYGCAVRVCVGGFGVNNKADAAGVWVIDMLISFV